MAILDLESSMQEVILRMTETGYGVAVLIDKKGLVSGVISDGDLRRNAENLLEQKPKSIASCDPVMVSPNDLIGSAVNKMESEKVYTVVVVENKKPIGLLRMHDLLKAGIA
jgi:arabinose-5-phosphate isomerase